jgi:Xaa-Pro aminopeptidase
MMCVSTSRPAAAPAPFTAAELRHRRASLLAAAAEEGASSVVAYGANRSGSAIGWLTTWPVTREAVVVLDPDGSGRDATAGGGVPALLLVGFPNHVPNARRAVLEAGLGDEVEPIDGDAASRTVEALARRGPPRAVGLVGQIPRDMHDAIARWSTRVVSLDRACARLRMTKSAEELAWLEYAAALTDGAAMALLRAAGDGASEREIVAAAEHSYRMAGGSHHICYVAVNTMDTPDRCAPAQWPGERRATPGCAVVFELSAGWGPDYPAQLLRTATVAAPPTPLYARLHAVAEAVRDELFDLIRPGVSPIELLAVLDKVRAEGFTTMDDVVHGLGGGYLPPVLNQRGKPLRGLHAEPLRPGMTLVVQPNICTPDLSAGVQTGEMVVVTETGCRSLHRFPPGLLRLPIDPVSGLGPW